MPTYYQHPLYNKPHMAKPARSGLGYHKPIAIQAQCIYQAEICVRIESGWYVQDDGFIPITSDEHIAILEQWYVDTCQN